jgi:toxin-antitoxin system PIN domain toxin
MIVIDTNLLIHAHHAEASLHAAAKTVVREQAESPAAWGICYHSLVEFYGVVTQPKIWRTASNPEQAVDQIRAWRESPSLRLLYDSAHSLELLEELSLAGKVRGPLVHDARIAACCLSHGIRELWTVDRDFSRFPKLKTRNPLC